MAAIPVAITAMSMVFDGSPRWRLVVLGYAVLLWLVSGWAYWGPVKGRDGRHWFAVTEGGLLVLVSASATPLLVLPWRSLREETRMVGSRLEWRDDDYRKRQLTLPAVTGPDALLRAIQRGGPVPPRRALRAVRAAALGSITALMVWFAVVPFLVDERPIDVADLSRICAGGGAFGQAAAYGGPGPHPVVVYEGDMDTPTYAGGWDRATGEWPQPDTVQLVGCSRRIGRVSEVPLQSCGPYGTADGYTYDTYQGHFRIDLYEARTGHQVTSVTVDGSRETNPCEPSVLIPSHAAELDTSRETEPDEDAYAERLTPVVNGKAGS